MLNGHEVPGCTSISGLFQDDGWKFAWPVKLMYEHVTTEGKAAIERNADEGLGFEELEDICAKAKNAWREKRDKSADSGTRAHQWIEEYIKTGSDTSFLEDKDAMACIGQFLVWEGKHKPKWLASELQVASERFCFAGILDALCEIDGKTVLLDFKTSASIKDEYAIQLAGLYICLEEMGFKPDLRAILHLPKKGDYEYRVLDGDLEEEKTDFVAALNFYRRKNLFWARCRDGNA